MARLAVDAAALEMARAEARMLRRSGGLQLLEVLGELEQRAPELAIALEGGAVLADAHLEYALNSAGDEHARSRFMLFASRLETAWQGALEALGR